MHLKPARNICVQRAGDGFTTAVFLKRPRRNVYESARAKYEKEDEVGTERVATAGVAYLMRYVGYVNVIIPRILKGQFSLSFSYMFSCEMRRNATDTNRSRKRFFRIKTVCIVLIFISRLEGSCCYFDATQSIIKTNIYCCLI